MNTHDIEDKLFDNELERTFTVRYGPEKGWTKTETGVLNDWMDMFHGGDSSWKVPGLGTVEVVQTFGGEGEGDRAWLVISVTDEDGTTKLFRKDGCHQSFDGTYLDGDLHEVTAAEKTITVYNTVR